MDLHTSILHGVHTSSFSGFICFHMKHTILHPYRCFGLLGIGLGTGFGEGTAPTLRIGWKDRVHDSSIFQAYHSPPLSFFTSDRRQPMYRTHRASASGSGRIAYRGPTCISTRVRATLRPCTRRSLYLSSETERRSFLLFRKTQRRRRRLYSRPDQRSCPAHQYTTPRRVS